MILTLGVSRRGVAIFSERPPQIGEAGCEPHHVHEIVGGGMDLYHLCGRYLGMLCDELEVRPVFTAVERWNVHDRRLLGWLFVQGFGDLR